MPADAIYYKGERFDRVGSYLPTFGKKVSKGTSYMWINSGRSDVKVIWQQGICYARKVSVTIVSTTYQYDTVSRDIEAYDAEGAGQYGAPNTGRIAYQETTFKKPTYKFSNGETEIGDWQYDSGDSYWDSIDIPDHPFYHPDTSQISGMTPYPGYGHQMISILYSKYDRGS